MRHIYIPDGILPVWLRVSGFVVVSIFPAFMLFRFRVIDVKKKIPLLGALAAAMPVGIHIPILPGYHLNLSVVSCILFFPQTEAGNCGDVPMVREPGCE